MEYEEKHLKDAGLLFDVFFQGHTLKALCKIFSLSLQQDTINNTLNIYQTLASHINLSHYITFLQKVSQAHLTDFYDMQAKKPKV